MKNTKIKGRQVEPGISRAVSPVLQTLFQPELCSPALHLLITDFESVACYSKQLFQIVKGIEPLGTGFRNTLFGLCLTR